MRNHTLTLAFFVTFSASAVYGNEAVLSVTVRAADQCEISKNDKDKTKGPKKDKDDWGNDNFPTTVYCSNGKPFSPGEEQPTVNSEQTITTEGDHEILTIRF